MGALQICVAVDRGRTSQGGQLVAAQLVILTSTSLGRAYLGAVVDAAGKLHAWLEVWVQVTGPVQSGDETEASTNPEIEARWGRWVQVMMKDADVIVTGYETHSALPVWIDPVNGQAQMPRHGETGAVFALCRDDSELKAAGLEPFSQSRERFLSVAGHPEAGYVALGAETPKGARSVFDVLPNRGANLLGFNPSGGSIFVRRLAPLEWEQQSKLLSGGTVIGVGTGRPPLNLGGPYALLQDWNKLQQSGAYLFSSARGRAGRFHEAFHLKLLLWLSTMRAVSARVTGTQLPQLNLRPAAFRVDLAAYPGSLPILWTARAVLVEPPAAVELPTPGELRHFKTVGVVGPSIYLPADAFRGARSRGEVRLRRVASEPEGMKIEATLVASELTDASPRDLVWVKLPLAHGSWFDLVGKIDASEGLARGEAVFRAGPMRGGGEVERTLRELEGSVFSSTPFRVLPLLSTPVDLYGLGVMAVQLLLTGGGKPLATAVDELLSFVRATKSQSGRVADRVRAVIAEDKRWLTSLGPHHHGHGLASPDEAAALLPQELWWDALALLGRFFPGAAENAFARDLGDAPARRLEAVFERAINELEVLVLRSQSLLLCDWPSNREIARVIRKTR